MHKGRSVALYVATDEGQGRAATVSVRMLPYCEVPLSGAGLGWAGLLACLLDFAWVSSRCLGFFRWLC